ncbi:hypothetical protein [Gemella morbillorum]
MMTNQKLVISLEFIWTNISIYPNYDGIILKKKNQILSKKPVNGKKMKIN